MEATWYTLFGAVLTAIFVVRYSEYRANKLAVVIDFAVPSIPPGPISDEVKTSYFSRAVIHNDTDKQLRTGSPCLEWKDSAKDSIKELGDGYKEYDIPARKSVDIPLFFAYPDVEKTFRIRVKCFGQDRWSDWTIPRSIGASTPDKLGIYDDNDANPGRSTSPE